MKKEEKKDTKKSIEKETKNKSNKDTKERAIKILENVDKNRKMIYSFVGGLLLGLLILALVWPDRIATLKDGTQPVAKIKGYTLTADALYEEMKDYFSVNKVLDLIDNEILVDLYPETDEMKNEVEETAQNYISTYSSYYGYTEEQFLSANGFANHEAFIEYLTLDYRRNKYYDKYLKDQVTDEEVESYYNDSVQGDINTQHILVEIDEDKDMDEKAAKALAEEIISKLDDGQTWEEVQKEYKDSITFEDLGYVAFDASLEDSFLEALRALKEDNYSKTPVKTSYGYHIIYRFDQKDKPELSDVEDDVIQVLADNIAKDDKNVYYKSLINMREKAKLKFSDSVIKSRYEAYCNQYK